ncbi:amidase [Sulfolobus tengchongensis]|uniref:Amidase n=1 Tax=Sulfolobus tengchongensis TaxID=207809 RepID=A0AAX4L2M7_9CREN
MQSNLKGLKFNAYITIIDDTEDEKFRIAIKDNMYTKGLRTTAASKVLYNFIPDYDATVVAKLKKDTRIKIVAKTNMHEFAIGGTNTSSIFGPTINPNDPELITGGSSGGSAVAVAVGDVNAALGTDTRGSIRIPAAFCGVYGFKPTFGRISNYGIIPVSWSLDHVGILSREVDSIRKVYNILKGYDPNDTNTMINLIVNEKRKGEKVKRIGIIKELTEDCDTKTDFMRFMDKLGLDVEEISIPLLPISIEVLDKFRAETAYYHSQFLKDHENDYFPDVLASIKQGFSVSGVDYVRVIMNRDEMIKEFVKIFNKYDLLACPTVPIYPPKVKDILENYTSHLLKFRKMLTRNTSSFNFLKVPAISVPINKFVGAQFIADIGCDEYLLNFVSSLSV